VSNRQREWRFNGRHKLYVYLHRKKAITSSTKLKVKECEQPSILRIDSDTNPETAADPNWLRSREDRPDPSYPGRMRHKRAGAEVLISFFERDRFEFDVTSEVLPGIDRSFTSFSSQLKKRH